MMHAHFTPNSGQMSIAAVRISNYRRANKRTATMDIAANKAIARRYFSEMVDQRSDKLIEELWTEDCVVHRPEVSATIMGREAFRQAFNRVVGPYSEVKTTSRLGGHAVAEGKVVTWSSLTMFRIRDGKIAEEWVCRDERGMLIQLGVVASAK